MPENDSTLPEKPRLLIVDDDAIQRDISQVIADRSGLFSAIETVATAEQALDRLVPNEAGGSSRPEMILSDLRLPGRTGLELARELVRHDETKSMPIALYTACDLPELRSVALSAGCRAVYEKPASIEEFLAIFSDLVQRCRAA